MLAVENGGARVISRGHPSRPAQIFSLNRGALTPTARTKPPPLASSEVGKGAIWSSLCRIEEVKR